MANNVLSYQTLIARAKKALFERRGEAVEVVMHLGTQADPRLLANWRQESLSLVEQGQRMIERWDVRKVGKLIDLFPEIAPPHWRQRPLVAEYGESGDWIVRPA